MPVSSASAGTSSAMSRSGTCTTHAESGDRPHRANSSGLAVRSGDTGYSTLTRAVSRAESSRRRRSARVPRSRTACHSRASTSSKRSRSLSSPAAACVDPSTRPDGTHASSRLSDDESSGTSRCASSTLTAYSNG